MEEKVRWSLSNTCDRGPPYGYVGTKRDTKIENVKKNQCVAANWVFDSFLRICVLLGLFHFQNITLHITQ